MKRSPPNMKQSPSRSDARAYSQFCHKSPNVEQSPSRSDTRLPFLKQCDGASQNKARIAGINMKRSPPNMKHSPTRSDARAHSQFHCKSPNVEQSPSRSDTQVPFLKQCAGASQKQAGIPGINMKQKAQSGATVPMLHPCSTSRGVIGKVDPQIQNDQREKKVLNADKVTMNHQSQDGPRKKSGSNATDNGIGRGSEMSPGNNIDLPVVINSSVQYTRRPPPENCWMGCFFDGSNCNLGDFKAYFPSKVSSKVLNVIKSLPIKLKLEILPRMDDWPKSFETTPPVYEDIGLFFFPTELNR
uniref:AIPP2-like SPOC-like domain-containing protein n=1 Tax=Leersia perrieri TaxID=77586 RepID=A0A0D9VBF4_9ORYZ